MEKHIFSQYIQTNTRQNNTLDLFLSNNPNFSQHVNVEDAYFTDHRIITIFTSYFANKIITVNENVSSPLDNNQLDFSKFNLNSTNFTALNLELSRMNWEVAFAGSIEEIPIKFNKLIFKALLNHSNLFPDHKSKFKNRFQRDRRIINRKIKKYKQFLSSSHYTGFKREVVITKMEKLNKLKKKSFFDEKISREKLAVSKIKTNSQYFFKYANNFRKTLSTPNILQDDDGNLVFCKKTIADMLQSQFISVFSTPKQNALPYTFPNNINITHPLTELIIDNNTIVKAIDKLKSSSSCPKHEIPTRIFKECKMTLSIPLQILWNRSFEEGIVPQAYKCQQITPVYKKGSKTKAVNFRPIARPSNPIKIIEIIIRYKLVQYFELNSIINTNQHGFRNQRSCTTQLLSHISFILSNLVEGNDVDCIYIDYAKAFDKVDHNILIQKLELYGINYKYLAWIKSFLSNRVQTVYNNGAFSFSTPVQSGVPQGSVLAPFFFIIFINDLPDEISGAKLLTFADDTKLIAKIKSTNDTFLLQNNLNTIINWSYNKNNMELNKEKFEYLSHKSQMHSQNLDLLNNLPFPQKYSQYFVSTSHEISRSTHVRDLGIIVDENINWKLHIHTIHKQCKQLCSWVLSVFHTREKYTMLVLFKSLIRSKLEYGCEIFNPHQIQEISKIEQIQRIFTSRISGMQNYNYWERLRELKLLSLQRRREKIIIIHLWKIHNNLFPNTIDINFKFHQRTSATRAIVKPLPRIRGMILTLYDQSFMIKAAKLWNVLPPNLTNISSLHLFKNGLNSFLLTVPDQPPLPGYPHTSDNSLTSVCS